MWKKEERKVGVEDGGFIYIPLTPYPIFSPAISITRLCSCLKMMMTTTMTTHFAEWNIENGKDRMVKWSRERIWLLLVRVSTLQRPPHSLHTTSNSVLRTWSGGVWTKARIWEGVKGVHIPTFISSSGCLCLPTRKGLIAESDEDWGLIIISITISYSSSTASNDFSPHLAGARDYIRHNWYPEW